MLTSKQHNIYQMLLLRLPAYSKPTWEWFLLVFSVDVKKSIAKTSEKQFIIKLIY